MQTILRNVKNALVALTTDCYHYHAPDRKPLAYIVWAEDMQEALDGDNKRSEMVWQGTIDYYTKTEFDELFDDIPEAIEDIDGTCHLNSIQYEEQTGFIHYEWVFEIG